MAFLRAVMALNVVLPNLASAVQKAVSDEHQLYHCLQAAMVVCTRRAAGFPVEDRELFGSLIEVRMQLCETACVHAVELSLFSNVWKWYGWMERVVECMGKAIFTGQDDDIDKLLDILYDQ